MTLPDPVPGNPTPGSPTPPSSPTPSEVPQVDPIGIPQPQPDVIDPGIGIPGRPGSTPGGIPNVPDMPGQRTSRHP